GDADALEDISRAGGDGLAIASGLTTPVAYMSALLIDPFGPASKVTPYIYHREKWGFILISAGPDMDYDITDPAEVYSGLPGEPGEKLIGGPWTYDPTNGTISNGDVWRVRDVQKANTP